MQKTTTIWFVRHGESMANASSLFQSRNDRLIPRSDRGFRQAKACALYLLGVQPDLILSSCHLRAVQTAWPLRQKMRYQPEYLQWPVLGEFHYLSVPGKTSGMERRKLTKLYWELADPNFVAMRGAESWAAFLARVQEAFVEVAQRPEERIVVFGHGQFFTGLHRVLLRKPISSEGMREFRKDSSLMPNCGIIKVVVNEGDMQVSRLWLGEEPITVPLLTK